MEYRNSTPFPSLAFEALDAQNQSFQVVAVRMTLNIQPDGTLQLAEQQIPLVMTDEFYGDPAKSSVKQESDLAPHKPWCDVIVLGEAVAPGNKPIPRFEAGIRISRKGNTVGRFQIHLQPTTMISMWPTPQFNIFPSLILRLRRPDLMVWPI